MSTDASSIPSSYSRLIARVLQLSERDLMSLLHSTQLSSKQFLQEDLLITAQQQVQIIENALALSEDQAFGLQLGKQLTPPTHGAMGFLAYSSPDFLTAMKAFQTYSPTRNNFTRIEVHAEGEWLRCYYNIDLDISSDIQRCITEAAAMSLFECAKFIIGREISEAVTYFAHPEPEYSHRYQDYLPGEFQFDSDLTFAKIPISVCQIPSVSANHENYLLAMRQCEPMLSQLHAHKDTCQYQLQKMMLSHPPGQLSEEAAAAALFISKRTLARRLAKEGTSYRQIRDDILSQQASKYLSDDHLSVEAIAALLNYHDSSNFRRAFKRWFSMTPDQYRKSQSSP